MTLAPGASVFSEFPARTYLEKYYSAVGAENDAFLRSITDYVGARDVPTDTVIEVAGGPCLYSLMALAAVRDEPFDHITFSDIGWRNLREVDTWLRDDPTQFGYAGVKKWLETETGASPAKVTGDLRASRWELAEFDWRKPVPLAWQRASDVVSSHFFAESATDDEDEFIGYLAKLGGLGRPGATLLLSLMSRSAGYQVGRREFPAYNVDRESILGYLERAGMHLEDVEVREVAAEDPTANPGYDGLLFVGARLF